MTGTATARPDAGTAGDAPELVLTAQQVERLRDWTLQEDGVERFAYVYCERDGDRLLAREVDPVPPEDCAVMESSAVRPELSVERERLGDAMAAGLVPIMVHSHPFSQVPGFSALDDDIMTSYRDWLGQLYPELPIGFVVMGHEGIDTAVYPDPTVDRRETLPVEVLGEWTLDTPLTAPTTAVAAEVDAERYDRSIRALTDDGQRRIADTTVGVVGLGGLGSMVAMQLARFGVTEFLFADPDGVERSNLPRIYGATEADVGRRKVDAVGERVVEANPDASVDAYPNRVQDVPESALRECDVIVGAVDRLDARLYCNEFAARHLRYYIDGGVSIETDDAAAVTEERGLVQLVVPGVNACLDCLGRNDPEHLRVEEMSPDEVDADVERGYLDEDVRSPEPAITPLNGTAAATIARQFTKLVTGYTAPEDYVRFDGLADELVAVGTHPAEGCVNCGADGQLAAGRHAFDADELVGGDDGVDMDLDLSDDETAHCRTITPGDTDSPTDAASTPPTTDGQTDAGSTAATADGQTNAQTDSSFIWGAGNRLAGDGGSGAESGSPSPGRRLTAAAREHKGAIAVALLLLAAYRAIRS